MAGNETRIRCLDGRRIRVLVVDDEPLLAELVAASP